MDTLEEALQRNPHLGDYLNELTRQGRPQPSFHPTLTRDLKNVRPIDFLYPVGDPIFIHLVEEPGGLFPRYYAIEPRIAPSEEKTYNVLRTEAFRIVPRIQVPENFGEYQKSLDTLLSQVLKDNVLTVGSGWRKQRFPVSPALGTKLRYILFRDLVEHGPLEPVMRDPWIEDVHGLGLQDLHVVHKIFGMTQTNIRFPDAFALDSFLEMMGERMGRPVSDSHPIVDGALPNGSRINIIYSKAVSLLGSSFTIRKFSETPLSVAQLVAWNTMSPRLAAYLWLCIEQGMSVFVSGETASGKTTTLNAVLPFMRAKSKILSVEDTPEILPPHANWQQLITRERGTKGSSVTMNDLLKAALRSRPNFIIVGEIRSAEGAVAFQAMQTGHPTLATFHASSVGKLIQRFSSDPMNVPPQFMDNLNVALIQMAVYVGGKMLRRVMAVEEIEGYSKQAKQVMTRQVFTWDSVADEHQFAGRNNSYVLESLVAKKMGFKDPREIYEELDKRARLLEELAKRDILGYEEVAKIIHDYEEKGEEGLPFRVEEAATVA